MSSEEKTTTQVIRDGLERLCKDFTTRINELGFRRTKKMFWCRQHPMTIDVIHFHRNGSTYGTPRNCSIDLRVHFAIRVRNDSFEGAALNGPFNDPTITRTGRYHHRFNAATGSTYERCLDDLSRFVVEQGDPWFLKFRNIKALLERPDSPLKSPEKELLAEANEGQSNPLNEALSSKILGLKSE